MAVPSRSKRHVCTDALGLIVRVFLPLLLLTPSLRAQGFGDVQTQYLNSRGVSLPFKIDPADISELRLFGSQNNSPWRYLTTARPNNSRFEYRAESDGVYNFAVQVVYKNGSMEPPDESRLSASHRVIIDTANPQIQLRGIFDRNGAPGVEWVVHDDNLDDASVFVQYRWPGQNSWVSHGPVRRADNLTWPLTANQTLDVRITATDLAKNVATSQHITIPVNGVGTGGTWQIQTDSKAQSSVPNRFFVNKRDIEITYEVEHQGPSGVRTRQLFVSKENGRWQDAGRDGSATEHDRTGKMRYHADQDGVYGFIVRGENLHGMSEGKPKDGDAPQVSVEVDTIKPEVHIRSVSVLPGVNGRNIVRVVWNATDKNLLARAPINIEYAPAGKDNPHPPEDRPEKWFEAQRGLGNLGTYDWLAPNEPPYAYWVRVTAVDEAGNRGLAVHEKPVFIDTEIPRLRINNVQGINSEPNGAGNPPGGSPAAPPGGRNFKPIQ